MKLLIGFLLSIGVLTCRDELTSPPPAECSLEATVVGYTGLDGCDFVLELADGKRFVPARLTYVRMPTPEEDPIYHFTLKAGEKVYFSYNSSKVYTACMMGEVVFITCIRSATAE